MRDRAGRRTTGAGCRAAGRARRRTGAGAGRGAFFAVRLATGIGLIWGSCPRWRVGLWSCLTLRRATEASRAGSRNRGPSTRCTKPATAGATAAMGADGWRDSQAARVDAGATTLFSREPSGTRQGRISRARSRDQNASMISPNVMHHWMGEVLQVVLKGELSGVLVRCEGWGWPRLIETSGLRELQSWNAPRSRCFA